MTISLLFVLKVSIVPRELWELQIRLGAHLVLIEQIRWEWMFLTVVCVQRVTIAELLERLHLLFVLLVSSVQKELPYQHLVLSGHSMPLQVFKILVNVSHAQQDITVLFLDSQQLTLQWSVMQDLFATDVLSDLSQLILLLVQSVLRADIVFKAALLNLSVQPGGLVSSKELMTQLLVSSVRRAFTVKALVEVQHLLKFVQQAHFVLKAHLIT